MFISSLLLSSMKIRILKEVVRHFGQCVNCVLAESDMKTTLVSVS